jgi:hypothetical protein
MKNRDVSWRVIFRWYHCAGVIGFLILFLWSISLAVLQAAVESGGEDSSDQFDKELLDFFPNSTIDEHDSVASVLDASSMSLYTPCLRPEARCPAPPSASFKKSLLADIVDAVHREKFALVLKKDGTVWG